MPGDALGQTSSPAAAVAALYSVAYTIKFTSKKTLDRDFVVAPLEGLWWADEFAAFTTGAKDTWRWTMLISQPDWIDEAAIEAAQAIATAKKKLPAISNVRQLTLHEGRCAQVLHLGSYDDEAPLLETLHGPFFQQHGLDFTGSHHEIYLGDPRRVEPARLKTILRQPVKRTEATSPR